MIRRTPLRLFTALVILMTSLIALMQANFSVEASNLSKRTISETINDDVKVVEDGFELTETGRVNGDVEVIRGSAEIFGTVRGDVNVAGGSAEIAGTVRGDVNVAGGSAEIAGTVKGDLVVLGGSITIAPTAAINGDCMVIGGSIEAVSNEISETETNPCISFLEDFDGSNIADSIPGLNLNLDKPGKPPTPDGPDIFDGDHHIGRDTGFSIAGTLGNTLFAGLLAFLLAAIAPRQLNRMGNAISAKPIATGTVGALTFMSTIALLAIVGLVTVLLFASVFLLCVGFLGIPVLFVLTLLLGVGSVVGWVAMGNLFGEIVAGWLHIHTPSILWTTVIGTVAMTLGLGLMEALPLGGIGAGITRMLIVSGGLGAAALTKFGMRTYPRFSVDPDKENDLLDSLETFSL